MRALVTCCTALTGCPFKSFESQKIQSSQRFIYQKNVFVVFGLFRDVLCYIFVKISIFEYSC